MDDPAGRSALIIGLAGGMTASLLRQYEMEVDSVDLDPAVIDLARRHFGFVGPAVAARLCVSPATARSHCRSVLRKLGARDRKELRAMLLGGG